MSISVNNKPNAVVCFSGGQDSTTCLVWAMERYKKVYAVSFDYGQTHKKELEAQKIITQKLGVYHEILSVDALKQIGNSSLFSNGDSNGKHPTLPYLPASFVPYRNQILLTLAAAYAFSLDIEHLITGVCQTDYSGYPDCRSGYIHELQEMLHTALGEPEEYWLRIHTPLMNLTKAETVRLMVDMGQLVLLADTHTCYHNQFPPCGKCPACELRAKGFKEANIIDPLTLRSV